MVTPEPSAPSIASLLEEARALRADVHTAERERRRQNRRSSAILAVLTLFVVVALVLAWQGNREIAQTHETNARIADCTDPSGTCYREGQVRTQSAVNDIIWASIYMAECARERPGDSGQGFNTWLESCVALKFAQHHATPGPSPSPSPSPPRPSVSSRSTSA